MATAGMLGADPTERRVPTDGHKVTVNRLHARALLACYFRSGNYRLRKATLEPPLRYLKQQESSNARLLIAQAVIDCAHKGIREPDEKRRPCAYEDPDRLNRREA